MNINATFICFLNLFLGYHNRSVIFTGGVQAMNWGGDPVHSQVISGEIRDGRCIKKNPKQKKKQHIDTN